MFRVRRYRSILVAEQAAEFLRSRGVPAAVVGIHGPDVIGLAGFGGFQDTALDLVIVSKGLRAAAEKLLQEFHTQPRAVEGEWEHLTEPDMSKLDDDVTVRCAQCGAEMLANQAHETCTSCGWTLNIVELVVQQHGPDVLAECYECEPEQGELDAAQYVVPCPSCGAALDGEDVRGRCSGCGALYDKEEIVRGFME